MVVYSPHPNINKTYWSRFSLLHPVKLIAMISIYGMIIPLFIMDTSLRIYQNIFFRVNKIPKVPREDYFGDKRFNLSQLSLVQKINCVYCGYANSVAAWGKAIAAQTEIYACSVKTKIETKGQEHRKNFTDYKDLL